MTEDRRNIYLWEPHQVGKYSPLWNSKGYTEEQRLYLVRNCDKLDFNWEDYLLKFSWKLKSELEEKKLRTYNCFYEAEAFFMSRGFFIHDWLLECWHDLIDRDIRITLNGSVKEFHLAHVIHAVDGIDREATKRVKALNGNEDNSYTKLVPKKTNNFMLNHQIAGDYNWKSYIYITPELVERTLQGKKKLKDVWIWTFKEEWDALFKYRYGEY